MLDEPPVDGQNAALHVRGVFPQYDVSPRSTTGVEEETDALSRDLGHRSTFEGEDPTPTRAVTWIDRHEPRVFHVYPDATDATPVLAPQQPDGLSNDAADLRGIATMIRGASALTRRRLALDHHHGE